MKELSTTHKHLIHHLTQRPHTLSELASHLKQRKASITSRLAELRRRGYYITFNPYHIILTANNFEETMDHNTFWDTPISIDYLAKTLSIPVEHLKTYLSYNFSRYQITQLSPTQIILRKPFKW